MRSLSSLWFALLAAAGSGCVAGSPAAEAGPAEYWRGSFAIAAAGGDGEKLYPTVPPALCADVLGWLEREL